MSTADMVKEGPLAEGAASGAPAGPTLGRWLGLAAAPTFAFMALWTALFNAAPDVLCMAMRSSSAVTGMTLMYLLMSVFHSSPWWRLIGGRAHATGHRPQQGR
jgi:hypothetical protein